MELTPLNIFPTMLVSCNAPSMAECVYNHVLNLDDSGWINNKKNSTTGNSYLLDEPSLIDVKLSIEDILREVLSSGYGFDLSVNNIKMTQSWANRSSSNEGHHSHNHPNSFLSGIFFLSDEGWGPTFKSPSHAHLYGNIGMNFDGGAPPHFSGEFTPDVYKGMLLIFPSGLDHYVDSNRTSGVRYTLSFNTKLTGPTGSYRNLMSDLTYSELQEQLASGRKL